MRKYNNILRGNLIQKNDSYEAQSIEQKMKSILTTKEPIDASAPILYTERKDGVNQMYDIRSDRFDIALEAMDKITAQKLATRLELIKGGEKGGETPVNTSDNKVS